MDSQMDRDLLILSFHQIIPMSSSSYNFFHFCFLLIISTNCFAKNTFQPKTLFLAVRKDPSTLQYITQIYQRTPLVPVKLAIHLGGESLWVDCEKGYKSSTYKPARCNSRQCDYVKSTACGQCDGKQRPGCNKNSCINVVGNPATETLMVGGEIAEDVLSIRSVNGSVPGPVVTVPKFIFSCAESFLTERLGKGVKGMVGFGQHRPASLAAQFASVFRFSRKFAICLSSSTERNGVIFIGHSPYFFSLAFDASRDLIYTPIITYPNYIYFNRDSPEYYIQVSSVKINGRNLPLNKTLLTLDLENDSHGTRISTAVPYTLLEASIYSVVSKAFVNAMPKDVHTVPAVQPFKTCFDSSAIGMSRLGYNAPEINLVLHRPNVYWTITGANSLVKVSDDVVCLAFVEGIQTLGQAIVIGGYQMQDNLVEFDLARKRIGFSNSLFFRQTTCSNHNYA
ncbi:probable aspartic proteinase GIP2 [Lycium ferocissimum]|uniref:probable aspartic proteinase GIP2 n=1 Tax=Lycium ferocissimum TaxID=112874 RepID=UPI0028154F76|nr:probable aspartic proteinase GIP2 [Lycium ferocissimum]